jgi:hypothetical protein
MRIFVAASVFTLMAATSGYAGAPTEQQVEGVQNTIKGMECTVEDSNIEMENGGYEADDVI